MCRKVLVVLGAVTFLLAVNKLSFAMSCGEHSGNMQIVQTSSSQHNQETMGKQEAVNVGNKICPVSGEKIGHGGMEAATYEYQGKIYNFCCAGCISDFKKDPGKYIKKIEEEKLLGTVIK